jgi:hypothetical protein
MRNVPAYSEKPFDFSSNAYNDITQTQQYADTYADSYTAVCLMCQHA